MKVLHARRILISVTTLVCLVCLPPGLRAQGSIFGLVSNSDFSIPPDGGLQFFGFINNSDREIRIQSCVGAGYEGGWWYDDFQNYVGESPGMPYRYYFFDIAAAERVLLSKTIPSNSYQQEDIVLASAIFPGAVEGIEATILDNHTVRLDWAGVNGVTWHVYRRDGSSDGSFFRVDNPAGSLSNRGVNVPYYVDNTVDSLGQYWYVLVTESSSGNYSPPSEPLYVDVNSCCQGLVGNINGIGGDEPSIGDIALLIDHLFISYTPPQCIPEADVNQSGGLHPTPGDVSLVDAVLLVNHLYIDFLPLKRCVDAGQ